MEEARTAALDRLNALLDNLFLTGESELWGKLDETKERIIAHGGAVEGDIELFSYAAVMTLRYAGCATLVEPNGLPRSGQIAAILRY